MNFSDTAKALLQKYFEKYQPYDGETEQTIDYLVAAHQAGIKRELQRILIFWPADEIREAILSRIKELTPEGEGKE